MLQRTRHSGTDITDNDNVSFFSSSISYLFRLVFDVFALVNVYVHGDHLVAFMLSRNIVLKKTCSLWSTPSNNECSFDRGLTIKWHMGDCADRRDRDFTLSIAHGSRESYFCE